MAIAPRKSCLMGWYWWISKREVWEARAAQEIMTDPKYLRCKDFFCARNGGDTQSHYYVWRHSGSCREQQINLPCWRLQSQGHSVSIRRLHLPLPGQTVCVLSSILCALTPGIHTHIHTHQFWYNCTGKHFSLSAHSVLPPFCCRCQAWGQADLPKVPSPPYAQHGPLLYLCIHRTADLMSVLISGRNLLIHWDRTDPEKPDSKDTQSCAPNWLS